MHFLGILILVFVVYWIASRATGSKGVGVGAAALTGVALVMLDSNRTDCHRAHRCIDYDA